MNNGSKRWAIVLAGGEGERMKPFINARFGADRPKQYCAFAGGRTLIEDALRRALSHAAPERLVTVIGPGHRRHLQTPRRLEVPGRLLEQPQSRGTGAGLLLALTDVLSRDPEAVVAVFPADHFIDPPERFRALLSEAYELAEFLPGQLVLLAARPEGPNPDYGWILPRGRFGRGGALLVDRFREKPSPEEARELHGRGGLCNTMIVVARAAALWERARVLEPAIARRFEALRWWMRTPEEAEAVALAYRGMPAFDFSRSLLERSADWSAALPMEDIEWSDWGRPERVLDTLKRRTAAAAA